MDATPTPEPGGPGGGGNGARRPAAFTVGYRPHSGDLMVYGGGALTFVGFLAMVVNAEPAFLIASIVGTLSALYFHPTLNLRTPQIGADVEGLYVARIGIIPWSEIAEMRVEHRALRTMRLATLIVRTARPLKQAVAKPERVPLMERFTAQNARVYGNTIKASLHTLNAPPADVEQRLMALYAAGRPGR